MLSAGVSSLLWRADMIDEGHGFSGSLIEDAWEVHLRFGGSWRPSKDEVEGEDTQTIDEE